MPLLKLIDQYLSFVDYINISLGGHRSLTIEPNGYDTYYIAVYTGYKLERSKLRADGILQALETARLKYQSEMNIEISKTDFEDLIRELINSKLRNYYVQ